MAGQLEESVELFLEQIFSNKDFDELEKKKIILSAMLSLADKITDGTHRWGMSMSLGKLAQEIKVKKAVAND